MIQNLRDNRWLKSAIFVVIPLLFIVIWMWISGAIFLQTVGLKSEIANVTPLTIYDYWYHYGDDIPTQKSLTGALFLGFFVALIPLFLLMVKRQRALFGDAKWATERDIKDAGLFSKDGIMVGEISGSIGMKKKYLVLGGATHVLMSAPTRSGKGVSIVVPNMLTWRDSVVVLDLKQENWDMTAGFRSAHGNKCYLLNFAPKNYKTHRWNPLYYVSSDKSFRINDVQKIGQMLFPNQQNEAPIWQASSRSLWLGLVLYLFESEDLPVTLGEVLRQITMGDERLAEIIEARQQSANPLSDQCYLALQEYLDTPEKTRGSIRKSFTSALELFYNPVIDAATAGNDFDLRKLRKTRMSVYLAITPDDLGRLAPLINLFFQQVIDLNIQELPEQNPELKYQCLLLPDEFTAMGKVGVLSSSISYIAGYGLRMLPIIQSPAQIREVYGADASETFIENHSLQIIFAPKSGKVAKEISETLGTTTVTNKSRSRQLPGFSGKMTRSESMSDTSRALLLPQEVKEIGKDSEILIMENCRPIKCKKITWYNDPVLKERGNDLDKNIVRWPSPEVPTIDPENIQKGEIEFRSNAISQTSKTVIERPITTSDIENIDKLDLKDFSCDFSKIEIPKDPISDEEMDMFVSGFFDVLHSQAA